MGQGLGRQRRATKGVGAWMGGRGEAATPRQGRTPCAPREVAGRLREVLLEREVPARRAPVSLGARGAGTDGGRGGRVTSGVRGGDRMREGKGVGLLGRAADTRAGGTAAIRGWVWPMARVQVTVTATKAWDYSR